MTLFSDSDACSIPDPDKEEVIIMGGAWKMTTVSVYSEDGWQMDLAKLTQARYFHACSSFTHSGEKVIVKAIYQHQNIGSYHFHST